MIVESDTFADAKKLSVCGEGKIRNHMENWCWLKTSLPRATTRDGVIQLFFGLAESAMDGGRQITMEERDNK